MNVDASSQPLVSCVMPTANRRRFVAQSIRYFQAQDYPNKELLVVDDGDDAVADLVPEDPQVRYIRLEGRRTLGAKRNECVEACRSDLIMHWDDDDWMSTRRISYQVGEMLRAGAEVCGVRQMLFYELTNGRTWLYTYPPAQRPWLAGGSLLYTRDFWRRSPFPRVQVASDTRFVWSQNLGRALTLPDYSFYVAMIHPANTSAKNCRGSYWSRWAGDIAAVMGEDWAFYEQMLPAGHVRETVQPRVAAAPFVPVVPQAEAEGKGLAVERRTPTYSIIMAVHNAREMTKMATLLTLRHTREEEDARLVVVDNASTDGAGEWLKMLARRGDIELLHSPRNIGHGPALELARRSTRSPYLVTLDSDAFPLRDDWLKQLRARLDDGAGVAGILHHRDYVHPSCLMIARAKLDKLGLTFLNEKEKRTRLDVAERISLEIKRRGGRIAGLKRTGELRRASRSEPVYLGSEYEGVVYHQWYTTRADLSVQRRSVDDVPREAIERSLSEAFERFNAPGRELTVVMGVRASDKEPQRTRNARACLEALNLQDLERWRYRLVVVEQDDAPRLEAALAPLADSYIFAYNPGPYNRGWAFNVGATQTCGRAPFLCLIDADMLVPPDFLRRNLSLAERGERAWLPYKEVVYLDRVSTERAISERLASPLVEFSARRYPGRPINTSQGGAVFVASDLYEEIGGHDERFRGWGAEDREFWKRLSLKVTIARQPDRLLHLDHPRPRMSDEWARSNQRLLAQLSAGTGAKETEARRPIGDINLYAAEKASEQPPRAQVRPTQKVLGRPWEPWHEWSAERIERIVEDERKQKGRGSSARRQLADLLVPMGDSLLDVGCGPGALWLHLEPHRRSFSWMGVDVAEGMLRAARRFFQDVPTSRADAGALPFKDKSFDLVLLRHVLEHLPAWLREKAVREALRVARRSVVVDLYAGQSITRQRGRGAGQADAAELSRLGAELEAHVTRAGWLAPERLRIAAMGEADEILILRPACATVVPAQPGQADSAGALKISIIMPTYHRPHTIQRAVESIKAQTYANWELIVVDNAGGAGYDFHDSRIRIYEHSEEASASYARNCGLRYATGDAVCFFDDDDEMFQHYLESFAVALQNNPRAGMVRSALILCDGRKVLGYATPACCVRREFATQTWKPGGEQQDNQYFGGLIAANGLSEQRGDIVVLHEALCRAHHDRRGGLRLGAY